MSTRTATRPRRSLQYRAIPPDPIDVLDNTCPGGFYHHSGPYDATLLSRNLHPKTSPVAAVADSNEAALAATPREFVTDSLTKHVPLQGTASVPPGGQTLDGGIMEYEDGTDMMREDRVEGGAYKRWAGIVSVSSFLLTAIKLFSCPLHLQQPWLTKGLFSPVLPPG